MTKIGLARATLQEIAERIIKGATCYFGTRNDCYGNERDIDGGKGKALIMYGRASHPTIGEDQVEE